MDDLFRQVVDDLDEEGLLRSYERLDELVSAFPDLRLSNLGSHSNVARALLSRLDLERGPLPGFEEAMKQLCALCVTPQAIRDLRSRLYSIAARVAETCPELLPTVAIASLSLDDPDRKQNTFVEMVVCASAIEWLIMSSLGDDDPISLDVSTWLAADPSAALIAAVGKERAFYYASIPGVLLFLDQSRVLFEAQQLLPFARTLFQSCGRHSGQVLNRLADKRYRTLLRVEIERVQEVLRWQYPDKSIADVDVLTNRALEALDELPPHVNPLLQVIFVQSWVRYLSETR